MPTERPVRIPAAFLAALCCLGAEVARAQDKAVVLRAVKQFDRPRTTLAPALRSSLLQPAQDWPQTLTMGGDTDSSGLDLEELLTRLHGGDRNAGKLEWKLTDGGTLLLSGDRALVANCDKELDRLAAAFARPIAVTAWLLPDTGPALPCVLDPQALAAELKDKTPLWTATARTQPFGQVTLADERWTNYVRDIDVEVAQKSQIGDPKLGFAFDGIRLSCTVEPLPDGDQLVLDAALSFGDRVDVRTVPTGVTGQPNLDLPEWRTALAQGAGRIQSGGAVVLQLRSRDNAGPSCRVLLSARFMAPPAPPIAADLMFVPVDALLHQPPPPTLPVLPHAYDTSLEFKPTQPAPFDDSTLGQYLELSAGGELDWAIQAGFLVVSAPAPQQDRVAAALRQLVAARLQNVELQSEARGALAEVQDGALPPTVRPPFELLWRLVLPALTNRPCSGFVGTEFNTISDFEVEIAQSAATNNPVISTCQSGLWSATLLRSQAQAVHADWISVLASQGPARPHVLGGKPEGHLGLTDARIAAFPLHGEIDPDQELDLGDGPIVVVGEQRLRTRQFVRLLRR